MLLVGRRPLVDMVNDAADDSHIIGGGRDDQHGSGGLEGPRDEDDYG